jgi:hypothetical protein
MPREGSGGKQGIALLGPAWISAIAALLGALVAVAGFFAIRATASSAPTVKPSRNGEPQATGSAASPSNSPQSPGGSPGDMLTQFSIDLPEGYGLTFGTTPSQPKEIDSGADLYLSWSNGFYTPDPYGKLARLDVDTPSYSDCTASTKFTTSVIFPKPGTTFCYLGHKVVVGLKIVKSLFGQYDTLSVVVWQAQPSPSN